MCEKNKTALEQDQLVRENARLRGDLLTLGSRISHDLRTPLGSVLCSGELLREILSEKEPPAAALTNPIFSSVDEMMRLIKRVSLITKASADPVLKERVKMEEIVTGILQRLESRILKKNATANSPDLWPEVAGVTSWLEFIWWNFLTNALQHGGSEIRLGWVQEKGGYRFWINDNGSGVPAEARGKLFQTFDSLHELGSTRGMGLSMVQRLVALQGGDCGYEMNAEGELCFYFTLPFSEA